jgi:cyclase
LNAPTAKCCALAVKVTAAMLLTLAAQPHAQAQELRTTHVAGGIYLISGAGANVTVSVGRNGVLVVDTGVTGMSEQLLAAIRDLLDGPIRYIVNTGISPERTGGNAVIRAAGETYTGGNAPVVAGVGVGAALIAHENLLLRMASRPNVVFDSLPSDPFYVPKTDIYFNGEPVEIFYQPNAVDDTNVVVHFRRSDVISAGEIFRLDGYPRIDRENGGSINGVLDALNRLLDMAVSDTLAEGGTLIIPGHGRISDEGDLVRYRDMVTIIRDRVAAWIDRGHSLTEIKAMQPSFEYDSRYGATSGPWTTDMFLDAVYHSLVDDQTRAPLRSAAN